MRVYWLSQYKPLESQMKELKKLFDQLELIEDKNPFDSVEVIAERYAKSGALDIVAVVPLSVLAKLYERGIKPLIPRMRRCREEEAEVRKRGHFYKFVCFVRLKNIDMEVEEIC
jgi:hypothetical protein